MPVYNKASTMKQLTVVFLHFSVFAIFFQYCSLAKTTEKIIANVTGEVQAKEVEKTPQQKLNSRQGLLMNQLLEAYSLTTAKKDLCRNHSNEFRQALRRFETWALNMFDASSKIQSGILYGNLFEFGNFKQCVAIQQDVESGILRGKHCTLKVYPDIKLLKKILSFRNISEKRWDKVKVFVERTPLSWSICVPDSCDVDDVLPHFRKLIKSLTEGLNLTIELRNINCLTELNDKGFNRSEMTIIASFVGYIIIITGLTFVDCCSPREKADASVLLRIFSARRNVKSIFTQGNQETSDLNCVHGIRFLSTCYVIIGHRYLMMMFFPVINSLHIMEWILYYRSTAITGGTLCVDTFFVVSGMLVSITFMNQKSKGSINWFMFYIYRYVRITPPLAIVVLWYATFMQYFGSGPLWNDMLEVIQKPCKEFWLATILHVQNYVNPYPLCLTQCWYLTCDMQYYYFSPIILVPLSSSSNFGYAVYGTIYVLSIAVNFYFAYLNKYNGGVPVTNQLFSTKYFQHYYIAPHTRASTYIIGLGFGFYVYKHRGATYNLNTFSVVTGWMLCVIIMLASLVGCLIFFHEEHEYNRLESSAFLALSRSSWSMGIVWIIWACVNGYGGIINTILSCQMFRILGKISYGMYLLHMGVQYMSSGAAKTPNYFSDYTSLTAAFGDLLLMVALGFVFTILFESPLIQILSLLTRRKSKS